MELYLPHDLWIFLKIEIKMYVVALEYDMQ